MKSIDLNTDIRSLSEFRMNTAAFIEHVKTEKRPLVITQHGKSSAILIDVEEFQSMLDRLHLLEEIMESRKALKQSDGTIHSDFMNELRKDYAE